MTSGLERSDLTRFSALSAPLGSHCSLRQDILLATGWCMLSNALDPGMSSLSCRNSHIMSGMLIDVGSSSFSLPTIANEQAAPSVHVTPTQPSQAESSEPCQFRRGYTPPPPRASSIWHAPSSTQAPSTRIEYESPQRSIPGARIGYNSPPRIPGTRIQYDSPTNSPRHASSSRSPATCVAQYDDDGYVTLKRKRDDDSEDDLELLDRIIRGRNESYKPSSAIALWEAVTKPIKSFFQGFRQGMWS